MKNCDDHFRSLSIDLRESFSPFITAMPFPR